MGKGDRGAEYGVGRTAEYRVAKYRVYRNNSGKVEEEWQNREGRMDECRENGGTVDEELWNRGLRTVE